MILSRLKHLYDIEKQKANKNSNKNYNWTWLTIEITEESIRNICNYTQGWRNKVLKKSNDHSKALN